MHEFESFPRFKIFFPSKTDSRTSSTGAPTNQRCSVLFVHRQFLVGPTKTHLTYQSSQKTSFEVQISFCFILNKYTMCPTTKSTKVNIYSVRVFSSFSHSKDLKYYNSGTGRYTRTMYHKSAKIDGTATTESRATPTPMNWFSNEKKGMHTSSRLSVNYKQNLT